MSTKRMSLVKSFARELIMNGKNNKNKPSKNNKNKPSKNNNETTTPRNPFIDGVRFRIVPDQKSAEKVFVHPDVDLAFIASVIRKDAYEGRSQFVSFTDESSESFFSKKRHLRSAANFKIANSTGRLAYYYGRDPMAMCEDPDLTGSLNHRLYMIYPKKPVSVDKEKLSDDGQIVSVDKEKLSGDVSNAENKPAYNDVQKVTNTKNKHAYNDDQKVSNAKNKPDYNDDQLYVGELIYNASSMVRDDGVIIILHHDSSWDMIELGKDYGLDFLMKVKFNKETFPDFSPRWGENDAKFDPTESSFYCFRVLKKNHRPSPTDGSKNASKPGMQLLLETEKVALKSNLKKVVTSMDLPQVSEHKALDSKRGVIHGGLVRHGVIEGLCSEVLLNEIEKIPKAFKPQALIPMYSAQPQNIEKALVDVTHPQPGEDSSPFIAPPPSIQMQPTDGSKNASQSHGDTSRHGLQLLLETEKIALKSNLQKVVTSMDFPQVTEHKALVSAHPHRHEIIQDLYTRSIDSKRRVIHGGLVRNGVSEGLFNEVLLNEMEKIRKAFNLQALIPLYSAKPQNTEKALLDVTHPQPGEDSSPLIAPVSVYLLGGELHAPCDIQCGSEKANGRFFPVRHGDIASTDKICQPTEFGAPKMSPLSHPLHSELSLARREISFSDSRCEHANRSLFSPRVPVMHDNVKSVMIY